MVIHITDQKTGTDIKINIEQPQCSFKISAESIKTAFAVRADRYKRYFNIGAKAPNPLPAE